MTGGAMASVLGRRTEAVGLGRAVLHLYVSGRGPRGTENNGPGLAKAVFSLCVGRGMNPGLDRSPFDRLRANGKEALWIALVVRNDPA